MGLTETLRARGHFNIKATHPTTLEITMDEDLSPRGDCIVAVKASKSLATFDRKFKDAVKRPNAIILTTIKVGDFTEVITGKGDQNLPLSHPTDIVLRKSSFICDRTLMINADKAARDLSREFVNMLRNPNAVIEVTFTVE